MVNPTKGRAMKLRGGIGVCAAVLAALGCTNQRLQEASAAPGWGQSSPYDAEIATVVPSPNFRGGRGAQWQSKNANEPGTRAISTVGKGSEWNDSRRADTMNVLETSPVLEAFTVALERTGMDKELEKPGELTVLAPNDFAFQQMSTAARVGLFGPNGNEQLKDLVRRHIVLGKYNSQELAEAGEVTTLAGTKVDVRNMAGLPQPGGAQVLSSTETRSGVVHQIDRVLSP